MLFLRLMSQLGEVVGTRCFKPLSTLVWIESVLGKIKKKIPAPPPVEKKKDRHLADLRDKRDKAQRVLDRLVEDAEKKRVSYEEACAKVNSQREELDGIVRQVDAAWVQVNLPTPPPTLPSDDGDWDQREESGVDGSKDEARREVEAGLGMDVDSSSWNRGRTRGRSRSPAAPVHASGRAHAPPTFYPVPIGIGLSQSWTAGNSDTACQ